MLEWIVKVKSKPHLNPHITFIFEQHEVSKHFRLFLLITFNKKSAKSWMLHKLHWLPVAKRIEFKLLVLVYKAHNGLAPQYLVELVQPYVPARTLRSSNDNLLVVPKYRLSTVGGRDFCIIGLKLWKKLPHKVNAASSLQTST